MAAPTKPARNTPNLEEVAQYKGERVLWYFDFTDVLGMGDSADTIDSAVVTVPATFTLVGTASTDGGDHYARQHIEVASGAQVGDSGIVTCTATTADGQILKRSKRITVIEDTAVTTTTTPDITVPATIYNLYPNDVRKLVFKYSDVLSGAEKVTAATITVATGLSAGTPTCLGQEVHVLVTVSGSATVGDLLEATCRATSSTGESLLRTAAVKVKDPAS